MKTLFVAYHFPPTAEVGAKRIVRFCRYLPEHGIEPIVLTADSTFYEAVDPSFPEPPGTRVIRTKLALNPFERYLRRRGTTESGGQQDVDYTARRRLDTFKRGFLWQILEPMQRQIVAAMWIPDRRRSWYRPAVEAASRLLESESVTAIVSSAPPYTCHLVARYLKRKYGVPWILDFRDAWMLNAWRKFDGLPSWRNWTDLRLESSCVHLADAVVCTSDEMRADFIRAYPDCSPQKFFTITNGFDETELSAIGPERLPQERIYLHLGTLYGDRRIDKFCRAVSLLVANGDFDPTTSKILFVGDADPGLVESARQNAPELISNGVIEFRPRVSWDEGQRLLMDAAALLVFQGHHTQAIPAKVFEYVSAGKPIFAVVNGGALANMIDTVQLGYWADPDDEADIAAKFLRSTRSLHRTAEEIRQSARKYHCRSLTKQLAELIAELARQKVRPSSE